MKKNHAGTTSRIATTSKRLIGDWPSGPSGMSIFPTTVKPMMTIAPPTTVNARPTGHGSGVPREILTLTRTGAG